MGNFEKHPCMVSFVVDFSSQDTYALMIADKKKTILYVIYIKRNNFYIIELNFISYYMLCVFQYCSLDVG